MEKDRYDIFISYRRDGGFETAKHLNDLLVRDGYTVSFDIDTLREGDFDETLLRRIDQCVDFILVVDKHTFDRTLDPNFNSKNDWLRTELAYALKLKKNIIPVLLSGVDGFPSNLPADIAGVITKNGPEYNKYYFDEFYSRLRSFLHCKPTGLKSNLIKRYFVSRRVLWLLLLIVTCVLLFFVLSQAVSPNKIYLSVSETPTNLNNSGITENYIAENIEDFVHSTEEETNEKLKDIFLIAYEIKLDSLQKDLTILSDVGLSGLKVETQVNGLVKKVREILGKKDVIVNLKLTENDSSIVGDFEMTDWEGSRYPKNIESFIRNFRNPNECAMDVVKKCVGYIALAYSPMASVLNDYQIEDVRNMYNGDHWKNYLYNDYEHIDILEEYVAKGQADSSVCQLLIGNLSDKLYWINKDVSLAKKAYKNYKRFSDTYPQYSKNLKVKLETLKIQVDNKKPDSIPDILIKNKIIKRNSLCSQLVVVTNQERINKEKAYFCANLYIYEKKGDKWEMIEHRFDTVYVGVEGIANPNEKREGDLKTPSGFYPISFAFGKKDKELDTKMEFRELNEYHVWVSDTSSKKYNQWVEDKENKYKSEEAERLWDIQPQYKYTIVIDYNTNPIVKGKGSAIFMHVQKKNVYGTAGCISMTENDIKSLIEWLDPARHPYIYIAKQINY